MLAEWGSPVTPTLQYISLGAPSARLETLETLTSFCLFKNFKEGPGECWFILPRCLSLLIHIILKINLCEMMDHYTLNNCVVSNSKWALFSRLWCIQCKLLCENQEGMIREQIYRNEHYRTLKFVSKIMAVIFLLWFSITFLARVRGKFLSPWCNSMWVMFPLWMSAYSECPSFAFLRILFQPLFLKLLFLL